MPMIYDILITTIIAVISSVIVFCLWLVVILALFLVFQGGYQIAESSFFGPPIYVTRPFTVGSIAGFLLGSIYGLLLGLTISRFETLSAFNGAWAGVIAGEILIWGGFLLLGLLIERNPIILLFSWAQRNIGFFLTLNAYFIAPFAMSGSVAQKLLTIWRGSAWPSLGL